MAGAGAAALRPRAELALLTVLFLIGGGLFWYYERAMPPEPQHGAQQEPRAASTPAAAPAIARALGVRHLHEGSVRKAGDRMRVTAQLIDAMADQHLWSEA